MRGAILLHPLYRYALAWIAVALMVLVGCDAPGNSIDQTVTVFAAASLTDALGEAAVAYQTAHPDTEVLLNFAGSQALAQQLIQGAPADLFISADAQQMAAVVANGRIDPAAVQPLTTNQLVIIVPADNPAGLQTAVDLARPGLKLVLADEAVPAGRYARQFLSEAAASGEPFPADFTDLVLANVVSLEVNVRAVLAKVALGEADTGIVYTTDAARSADVQTILLPESLNPQALYPMALVNSNEAAADFAAFLQAAEGQAILESYGFAANPSR